MLPAHERFHAVHVAGVQLHLGLEVQDELVAPEGVPQLVPGAQHGVGRGVVPQGEHQVAQPPGLGAVHGDVGPAQQETQLAAVVRGDGDADAHIDLQRQPREGERRRDGGADAACHPGRGVGVGVVQHDGELVATEPRQHVSGIQRPVQPAAHLGEELVPHLVTEAVVDLLELVQVQQQQRATGARGTEQPWGGLVERAAVGQSGEVVGGRLDSQVRHPSQLAEHQQRPGGGGREREGGQADCHQGHLVNAADDQHTDCGCGRHPGGGEQGPGVGDPGRRRGCVRVRRLPPRPQGHEGETGRPGRVQERADGVRAGGDLQRVDGVGDGEDQQPDDEQPPVPVLATAPQQRHGREGCDQDQVRHREGGGDQSNQGVGHVGQGARDEGAERDREHGGRPEGSEAGVQRHGGRHLSGLAADDDHDRRDHEGVEAEVEDVGHRGEGWLGAHRSSHGVVHVSGGEGRDGEGGQLYLGATAAGPPGHEPAVQRRDHDRGDGDGDPVAGGQDLHDVQDQRADQQAEPHGVDGTPACASWSCGAHLRAPRGGGRRGGSTGFPGSCSRRTGAVAA